MTRYFSFLLILVLTACGTNANKERNVVSTIGNATIVGDSISHINNEPDEDIDENYATYYLVVADTNSDYFLLRTKMFRLNKQLNMPIDTMGRYFNKKKNLIALPDNDEDEIYAGDYFPRRSPTDNLSLEYLSFYQKQASEKTIVLVAGMYEEEQSADSVLAVLKFVEKSAFKIKAEVYIGCMH